MKTSDLKKQNMERDTVMENNQGEVTSKMNEETVMKENVQEPETQNMEETSEDDNTYFEDNSEEVEEKLYFIVHEGFLLPQSDGSFVLKEK